MMDWPTTFQEAFCRTFKCQPADYEKRALRRLLYRRARLLGPVVWALTPRLRRLDIEVVQAIGLSRNWGQLRADLGTYSSNSRMSRSFLRNRLKLRISGRRALKLAERLFGPEPRVKADPRPTW